MFEFLMIVDDPDIARYVSGAGVNRLFVDLEHIGKQERQKNLATWKSQQTMQDVSKIRDAAPDAHVLVRINPIHDNTEHEVDEAIARGADSLMLPMFRQMQDLERFYAAIDGRVEAVPLAETKAGLDLIPDAIKHLPVTRLHIGLNDLHLDMGYQFIFQPLVDGVLETSCAALRAAKIPFGIGGIARAGEGAVSSYYLVGEHVRLGSSGAILSRTFHRNAKRLQDLTKDMDFTDEIAKLRRIYDAFLKAPKAEITKNQQEIYNRVQNAVHVINAQNTIGST